MKKTFIVIAILVVLAFGWYWWTLQKEKPSTTDAEPSDDASQASDAGTSSSTQSKNSSSSAVSSAITSSQGNSLEVSSDGTQVSVSKSSSVLPDLSDLREKSWISNIYPGKLDRSDTYLFNYNTSFEPVSNPLALVGYNNQEAFSVSLCGTANDCTFSEINPVDFPFEISYGYSDDLKSYLSSDLNTLLLVQGDNVIKKLTAGQGVIVAQGESKIEVQAVPVAADLNQKNWNTEVFIASTDRFGGDYAPWIKSFNPFFGKTAGLKVIPNTMADKEALFCRKGSGDYPACDKKIVTAQDYPYLIVYPDRLNSDGSPKEMAWVSQNQREVLLSKIIPGERAGTLRVFKSYTR